MQSDSALTVVETTDEGDEVGGDGDEEVTVDEDENEEDLETVQPTENWQTLKPGSVLGGVQLLWDHNKTSG